MSHHESAAEGKDSRMVDRMLFFSDAVFAIVLTLLALELRPPEHTSVLEGLREMRFQFFGFVVSFMLGGVNWIVHMRNARLLRQFDWPAAWTNLLHLFAVTLLP